MRSLKALLMLIFLLGLAACGSKRNPTGGAADTDRPTLLSSSPAEFGDISGKVIEIDFSKTMDKSSITNAIYFHPPIADTRISLSRATLRIEIREELQKDTFYHIILSSRLKDLRGNQLDKEHSLVFRHGNPPTASLSGLINYDNPADMEAKVRFSLFSADSLLVMMDELSGSSYEIGSLNPAEYKLRAYIDKNLNGRYDTSAEPFFEQSVKASTRTTMDINLAYVDTTMAQIRRINRISPQELEIELSKPISYLEHVEIVARDNNAELTILRRFLDADRVYLLTSAPDSLEYSIRMRNLKDNRGNMSPATGMQYTPSLTKTESPLQLLALQPRNGATVADLQPIIELHFSRIMLPENLKLSLLATDNKTEVEWEIVNNNGRKLQIRPKKALANYRSYQIIVHKETKDFGGNTLEANRESVFLPIKR
jgi:hypothetical protein